MIVGDPDVFAIESWISEAYEDTSLRALGYFLIHVGGLKYGVDDPDASILACSFDEVERRIAFQGKHTAPLMSASAAFALAEAAYDVIYSEQPRESYLGITASDLATAIHKSNAIWAPDGDAAFDDGSFILQFDVDGRVRLLAFKIAERGDCLPEAVRDIWILSDQFYGILRVWRDKFVEEWQNAPKK